MTIELKVNDTILLAMPVGDDAPQPAGAPVTLMDFRRDYEQPAKLTFSVGGDVFATPLSPDSIVQLTVDGQLIFLGLLDPVQPMAREGEPPAQLYTARDHAAALKQARLLDVWDRQTIHLDAGKLSDVLAEYLEYVEGELARVGLSDEFLFSGNAADLWTYPTSVSADDVDAGFRAIAANTLGVRCFIDPAGGEPAYRYVPVFQSTPFDLAFEDVRIGEFSIRRSTDGRVGAVRTASGIDAGEYEAWQNGALLPAWTEQAAHAYSPNDAATDDTEAPDVVATDHSLKFRRWSFAAFRDQIERGAKLYAYADVLLGEDVRRVKYEIESVDWDAATITLRLPAVRAKYINQSMGHDPFNAPAAAMMLRYAMPSRADINTPSYRIPTSGFAGRAFALRPIFCGVEALIQLPAGISRDEYAAQAYAVLTEPVTEGSIPFNDDLPLDLVGLDRRINVVRTSGGTTGYEQLAAPLAAITYDFNQRHGTLEFSDDKTTQMKGGSN